MNRTTIVSEAAYLMPQTTPSMSQKLMNYGASWFIPGYRDVRSLEFIRESMLTEIDGRFGCMELVSAKVVRARDITDLWLLRSALSAAFTIDRGADGASKSMQKITSLFGGVMVKPMRERRSVLNH